MKAAPTETEPQCGKMFAGRACRIISEPFMMAEDQKSVVFDPAKSQTKRIQHVMIEWLNWRESDKGKKKVAAPLHLIYEPSEPGEPSQRPTL